MAKKNKNNVKVSLIFTVFYEADNISGLLESIVVQKRLPDETIIVDGGSTDGTAEKIKIFFEDNPQINGELIIAGGANIARGRNIAIEACKYPIIAVTDGGCRLTPDWLEKLVTPFEKENPPSIVGGYYKPEDFGYFTRCSGFLLAPNASKINIARFLPSSRSVAFTKDIWKKVGGYPENIYNAEDTLFDIKMLNAGAKMVVVPDAIVYWMPSTSFKKFMRQFYNYRKSDIEAGLWKRTYLRSLATTFTALLALIIPESVILFCVAYLISGALVIRRIDKNQLSLLPGVIVLRLLQDISESIGIVAGFLTRLFHGR